MNIKVKPINPKTQFEVDDPTTMYKIQATIEEAVKKEFPDLEFKVKIYGELISMEKKF